MSEDGLVMKYKLINGPYLFGQRQIKLDMVLGDVEGLNISNIRTVAVFDRFVNRNSSKSDFQYDI